MLPVKAEEEPLVLVDFPVDTDGQSFLVMMGGTFVQVPAGIQSVPDIVVDIVVILGIVIGKLGDLGGYRGIDAEPARIVRHNVEGPHVSYHPALCHPAHTIETRPPGHLP